MQDFADVDAYIAASDQWPGEIAALRPILLDRGLTETIKWGKPCYCLGDANVAIVQEFSEHLALLFTKGILLDDAAGLLRDQGPNTHGPKRVEFTSVAEVTDRSDAIAAYLDAAIEHERNGTELPPRPDEPLATELATRLADDAELADAFEALTPGRRREYNLHVSGAKQASTRESRVDEIVPRIRDGKGLRDR